MGYYPKNLYGVPQYVAAFTFYPMGLFFGYYLNLFYLNQGTRNLLTDIAIWPICAGVLAAGITAFIQVAIKITYKKYIFEHFYLLMIGLFSIFVGGIIISSNESDVSSSLFICFIGHGICYVTSMSYINIRTAKSEKRFVIVSIPGLMYLIGITIGSQCTITKVKSEIDPLNEYEEVNDIVGSVITLASSLIIVCYLVNEVLHWINSYDYKSSLDPDVNRENVARTLFHDKYFCVTSTNEGIPINCRYGAKPSLVKRKMRAFFFIYSNLISILYFYFPFIYFNKYTHSINESDSFFLIFWFGMLGCGLSLIVQFFFTNRVVYFVAIVFKIIGLCLFLLFLEIFKSESHDIILYVLFCTLGFHYQANDVNIISYGSLKYIEVEIFISYMLQYSAIGIIQYITIMSPKQFFNFDRDIVFLYHQGLILMGLLVVSLFLGAYILPKGKQISLLEIKNIINHRPPPIRLTHVLSVRSHSHTASTLSELYPHFNHQCFQPQFHHYPRMECRQVNSQPYNYQSNPIVLTPNEFAEQKW